MEEFITACPRNCYSTCTFRVQVDDGRIRRILPYSGNKATPEGPCIKGLSYIERANSPDRIIPFLFVAFIKLTLSLYAYFSEAQSVERSVLRFIRMALLIIPGASMVSGISYPETPVVALFIAGEMLDRIFFYTGFKPGSLSMSINNKITERYNEKERD